MKDKWISIKQLKKHEFHTTLRKLNKDENNWARRFAILSELEDNAIQQFMKFFGMIVVAYLLVTSLRTDELLEVKIYSFEASIPAAYFFTASGFLLLITSLALCHLSVAMSLKITESGKIILSGFSTATYGLLQGKKDDISLGISEYRNQFLKEKFGISGFLSLSVALGVFAALIPLMAFALFLLREQYFLVLNPKTTVLQIVSLFFGMFFVITSILYSFFFHTPLPMKKDARSIRWGFLVNLHPARHPQTDNWLNTE